jgi:hypothetical protein
MGVAAAAEAAAAAGVSRCGYDWHAAAGASLVRHTMRTQYAVVPQRLPVARDAQDVEVLLQGMRNILRLGTRARAVRVVHAGST